MGAGRANSSATGTCGDPNPVCMPYNISWKTLEKENIHSSNLHPQKKKKNMERERKQPASFLVSGIGRNTGKIICQIFLELEKLSIQNKNGLDISVKKEKKIIMAKIT